MRFPDAGLLTGAALMFVVIVSLAAQRPWGEVRRIDGDPVMSGLPRDAIPAIDRPVFVSGAEASFMQPQEYVIGVADGDAAKAYSTWHLNAHEIVNDVLGDVPIAVTWCPLCFTAIVYDRRVAARTLSFGVTGMLWRENLVMYDRETDSWWAQASGQAIYGALSGRTLRQVAASMMTWREWSRRHPDTLVLSKRDPQGVTGLTDVYAGYHASDDLGVTGRIPRPDSRLDPKSRVLGFRVDGRAYAVLLDALAEATIVLAGSDEGQIIVAASPAGSSGRVFRSADHRFSATADPGELVDERTGSRWSAFDGRAMSGPLAGTTLDEVPSSPAYWFAWQAFFPRSEILPSPTDDTERGSDP